MKKVPTIIYSVALLRMIASAISGFAIDIFVRLSGASNLEISLISAVPSVIYMIAALLISGQADRLGRRTTVLIASGVSLLAIIAYMGIFVAVRDLSLLIFAVIIVASTEATFAAWFWPVLQVQLGEVAKAGGSEIRFYNLSWNLGIILGNALVAGYAGVSASLIVLFPIVMQVLVWTVIINGIIFGLLWGKFGKDSIIPVTHVSVVVTPEVRPSRTPLSVGIVLVALFAFAFNVGGILTNLFNQVTAISATASVAVNLLPWIPVIDTTRQMAQLAGSSTYKVSKPALNDITRIMAMMSMLAMLSGAASTFLVKGGITILVFVLGIHGLLSGILYNATMKVLLRDAPANQRGRFQGFYEAMLGLGFFAGPVVAGAVSEVRGFVTSYNVLAGVSFVATGILASIQVGIMQASYAQTNNPAPAKYRNFIGTIKSVLGIVAMWMTFGIMGSRGFLGTSEGMTLVIVGTAVATVVFLKPRSDEMHAFDHFISPRPHIATTCAPNSLCIYIDQAPEPLEVVPVGPG